jgi:hypothetical protein
LKRDFQGLIDGGDGQAKRLGYDLKRAAHRLFVHWPDYRAGTTQRAAFVRRLTPVRREVERLLRRGATSGNRSIAGMRRELHDHRDWLWAFVRVEGVEPTNNASERALRHAVNLAEAVVRHAERRREPVRRNYAHRDRILPTAEQERLRLRRPSRPGPLRRAKKPLATSRGVNGYATRPCHCRSGASGLSLPLAVRRVSELASGLTRNQVSRKGLWVRIPCPPLYLRRFMPNPVAPMFARRTWMK